MLTKEQITTINELTIKYAPLMEGFPKWDPTKTEFVFFPDTNDLKAIAEKVEPCNFAIHSERPYSSPKSFCKFIFVRYLQPRLRLLFKRQMFFNEYMWLLANTVAMQNHKIMTLEEKLNEIQRKNSN